MKADVSRWPTVDFKGVIFDVKLPLPGKPGWHRCEIGRECESCIEQREKQDRELRERMMQLRGAP